MPTMTDATFVREALRWKVTPHTMTLINRCAMNKGIVPASMTIGQLRDLGRDDLQKIKGMGPRRLATIDDALQPVGGLSRAR